ncbi:MAG: RNA polymerase sigma factor RpoD/SigA [Verrucomicrobia bacterium]|nr:RNA polymerase sigma factor RpoD/SigA [Verrucomicrobiota bacterium]
MTDAFAADSSPRANSEDVPNGTFSVRSSEALSSDYRGRPDALALYMSAVGEVPLLTPAQEIELAARIRRGDGAARDWLIRANLRFVIKIAREYEHLGMPLLDLINEGNIGLMLAVDRFDPCKGAKLTTYAVLWIRQSIRRALASQGKTIRLPVHVVDQNYHLGRAEMRLREELGRDATDTELAAELGLTCDRIGELRLVSARPASIDAPLGDDDSSRLADVVPDENAALPGFNLDQEDSYELLKEVLPKLPPREAAIIRLRFGLEGGVEKTLEEIGAIMRLTRERIRQLQNVALSRLRRLLEERDFFSTAA